MSDILKSGQLKHCRKKADEISRDLARREELFQKQLNKIHQDHNDTVFRMQEQVRKLLEEANEIANELRASRASPPATGGNEVTPR